MTDRVVLVLFALVSLGAGAAVIVPLHDHFAKQEAAKAAAVAGLGAARASSVTQIMAAVAKGSPPGARLQDVSLKPDDATVIVEDPAHGENRTWGLDDSGKVAKFGTSDASGDYGIPVGSFDAAAPERVVREVLARTGHPESTFESISWNVSPSDHSVNWSIHLTHVPVRDQSWIALGPQGAHLHRFG